MIQLQNISKKYITGDLEQVALDNVSLNLRDNEFVAILGPSGSGKTTLLNIIGGLDRYDSGDIIINNISTKDYKDRDWDSYRNHTIGFVFQSYNLIPHQTVLSNVELALTISGVSPEERKERALQALDEVGLKEQAYKKPNQMSGGQMQRVAIARALVNNPEIVLADEPTGALDTKTSVQVMDLLKEVAKDRLVVMVTHNPELAEEYATRIVKLRDGNIIDDSNPLHIEETPSEEISSDNFGKAKMGFLTALSLSFNNLLTKKGRTILTAFAGSIGIIGIALILSLSQGFQNYIDKIQEDTLTSYPLTITKETADMSSLILSMASDAQDMKNDKQKDVVKERQFLLDMADSIGINDLKSFKKHIEKNRKTVNKDVNSVSYTYSVSPLIYTIDGADNLTQINPSKMMSAFSGGRSSSLMMGGSMSGSFIEISNDKTAMKENYEVLAGRLPKKYNEVILCLKEEGSIADFLVYSLGIRDTAELKTIMTSIMAGEEPDIHHEAKQFTYEDLMKLDFRLINPSDKYKYNSSYDVYEDMSNDETFMRNLYDNSEKLKVVGVVTYKDSDSLMAQSCIAYTTDLTKHIIDTASKSDIVKKQLANENINVFSGKEFDDEEDSKALDFKNMISVDQGALSSAFDGMNSIGSAMNPDKSKEIVEKAANESANEILNGLDAETLTTQFVQLNTAVFGKSLQDFPVNDITQASSIASNITGAYYKNLFNDIAGSMGGPLSQLLDDSDFETLSSAVRDMFVDFYNNIAAGDDQATAFNKATQNGSALGKTTSVINNVMNKYTTFIVAKGIGQATGEIMDPLTKSLSGMKVDGSKIASAFKFNMSQDDLSRLMETMMNGGGKLATADSNLISLGYQDLDNPTAINFYFKSFNSKENFLNFIEKYNNKVKEEKKIQYTDTTGLLMGSVQTIVNSVSYVLIAFVSISLIVSSIMIAVITLISVMERRKEIGILRAMGASKKNVSSIFNAETFIIGLLSGCVGIAFTLAVIPGINALIHKLTDNYDINAVLPVRYAITLIIISVVLTMLAGFMPAKKASKNDPVEALRAE